VHSVRIQPFYLAKTELTQRTWMLLIADNPSVETGPDVPVHNVSWEDAQRWIALANARVPGGGFRLPTEAEWEYAARAAPGTEASLEQTAWYRVTQRSRIRPAVTSWSPTPHAPSPVGRSKPHGWRLP
jgi:formylglycine-generating enzyme required for sulfatase activity